MYNLDHDRSCRADGAWGEKAAQQNQAVLGPLNQFDADLCGAKRSHQCSHRYDAQDRNGYESSTRSTGASPVHHGTQYNSAERTCEHDEWGLNARCIRGNTIGAVEEAWQPGL
jgi:hypothetical protein